jgi:hypothetical protein
MYKKQRPQILLFRQAVGTGFKELSRGLSKDKTRSAFNRLFTVFFFVSSGFYNNLVDQKSFYFFS